MGGFCCFAPRWRIPGRERNPKAAAADRIYFREGGRYKCGMLFLTVDLTIKPEHVEKFLALVVENAVASRAEPGCRQFDVLIDPENRTRVLLFEIYHDDIAFERHEHSTHFQTYLADDILTKVDIASMAHALEVRAPLLDHVLLERMVATK